MRTKLTHCVNYKDQIDTSFKHLTTFRLPNLMVVIYWTNITQSVKLKNNIKLIETTKTKLTYCINYQNHLHNLPYFFSIT